MSGHIDEEILKSVNKEREINELYQEYKKSIDEQDKLKADLSSKYCMNTSANDRLNKIRLRLKRKLINRKYEKEPEPDYSKYF